MKRLILSMLMAVLTTVALWAARAYSEPFTVSQPDGTTLTITLYGDEHVSWLTTADGTLVLETKQGYMVAAIDDNGMLTATSHLAHNPGMLTLDEQVARMQQAQQRSLFFEQAERTMQQARRAQVTNTSYLPHTGSPRCLVILANFSDVAFASDDPKAQFTQYFSGDTQQNLGHNEQNNLVSVRRYFELSSHGKFTPQFDIVGPITLPNTQDYYGADQGESKDINFNQFCKDAIAAVDGQIDFREYDNNGDNAAELVCVIYAGYGQSVSGNPANTIWPKCSGQSLSTADGVRVNYMNCSPELYRVTKGNDINGIGLFTHEFSHGMGLPDLYANNTDAQINNQSPEFWDLMDYGEYANSGYAPVPYTAWEQEAMGWIEIEELTKTQTDIELKPLIQGGKAYKFSNGANSEEWIIVENVQARDNVQKIPGFAYGHGLLAWHIAYASNKVSMGDYPNNKANSPRVSIIPADGLVINGYQFGEGKPYTQSDYTNSLKGDPFPGTGSITQLTAEQELPNFTYYNGEATPKASLKNIAETTAGIVTFDYDSGSSTGIRSISLDHSAHNDYYTLDGRRLNGQPTRSGLYITQGRKVMVR